MSVRLSAAQRAQLPDCICPLPPGIKRQHRPSVKALLLPLIIFIAVTGIVALFSVQGALWLWGIFAVLAVASMIVRVVRGHALRCVLVWGPVAALYWIGDGIASATP